MISEPSPLINGMFTTAEVENQELLAEMDTMRRELESFKREAEELRPKAEELETAKVMIKSLRDRNEKLTIVLKRLKEKFNL